MTRPDIKLGDKARCRVTGFTGIVTSLTDYIDGCRQACLTPGVGKDGTVRDSYHFDVERLEIKKKAAVRLDARFTGGPQPAPPVR